MQPATIIAMLQRTCRHANDQLTTRSKRGPLSEAQIVAQLRSPRRALTRRIIGWLLALCRRSLQRRETTKSHAIAHVHELRQAYRHLAGQLRTAGLLPDAELIFYLRRDELAQLMRPAAATGCANAAGHYRANGSALIAKAQRRQRLWPVWSALRFDELNAYLAQPKADADSSTAPADADAVVRGTTVCEGVVRARACVITSFAECERIRAGDVLVTTATDIAWSTYFPLLGGVVTELGGLISHGAVVAREYGLPCVVGAVEATRRLRDGERVVLDATRGLVWHEAEGEGEEEEEKRAGTVGVKAEVGVLEESEA